MEFDLGNEFSSLTTQKIIFIFLRFCLFIPLFIVLFRSYKKWKNLQNVMDQLPGLKVRALNPLGHLSLLFNKYIFKYPAPFHAYHSLLMNAVTKAYGKDGLTKVWQASYPAVIVYSADAVEMILSHSSEIKKAWFYDFLHPWFGQGLLTSGGSKWRQRRKLLTSAFHFNILRDFLLVFNKQSRIFVKVLQDHTSNKHVDIVPLITKCSFDIICETILGEEMHSQTKDNDYLKSIIAISDTMADRVLKPWLWPNIVFYLSPTGSKQRYYLKKVRKFASELITKKKNEKLEMKLHGHDKQEESKDEEIDSRKRRALLDLLLDEHIDNNSISEQDIREEVDTFTFEGHDTTSMGMSWSLFLIGHHPEVQEKIHAELDSLFGEDERDPTIDDLRNMKYLECVIKEALRIYPSVPGYGRELQQDLIFKGHKIPKECTCFVWAYALHRDPEVFPNPEKFDPDRFSPENSAGRHPFAYVPFSAGPRNCIGQKFAMMEEKSVLSAVLRKYTVRSLQPRDHVFDTFVVVLRPFGGLKMEIRNRK